MSPSPSSPAPRRWYVKKRIYAALLIVLMLIGFSAATVAFLFRPNFIVQRLLNTTGAPVTIKQAKWEKGTLILTRVRVGAGAKDESSENVFFAARKIVLRWSWLELLIGGRMELVEMHYPQVWVSRFNKATKSSGNGGSKSQSGSWSITTLKIYSGTLTLDNLGEDLQAVPITVGRNEPLVLNDIQLSGQGGGDAVTREHIATIEGLTITSPFDPMSPVLNFKVINIGFTWAELRQSQIRRIEMIGPTIYLGPDLFWFADQFSKRRQEPGGAAAVPWQIKDLQVRAGQLAINAFGQPGITLPFTFVSSAQNIRLDQLDKITINNKILIPSQDRSYPEYKVRWEDLHGEISFALPLSDKTAKNVVNTINVKNIAWNELQVTDAWSSVTFDRNGIYGKMEGKCYGGYLSTDFAIFFQSGFPWEGHFFAKNVDSSPIAAKLVPSYLSLTGILNGKLSVNGKATEIVRTTGDLALQPPGIMQIKSIDDLVKRLPADWNFIKRDLVTIVLESFRTYNYTQGQITLDYQPPTAVGMLKLGGLQGERNFTVNWHQDSQSSEVAKPTTKR